MPGHFETIEGEPIIWADASIERLDAGYEDFTIHVREDRATRKMITCSGYIGFQIVGFWDEVIVQSAQFHVDHSFIRECELRVVSLPDSGSKARIRIGNTLLEVTLIDGGKLWLCGSNFHSRTL